MLEVGRTHVKPDACGRDDAVMRRHVANVLLALAVFLVAGEILARALDVVDRLNGYNRLLYARGPSRELPYVLRPNLSVTLFGVPVHVNRLGLRDREIDVAPKPGVHRVLMLGDSVLFGTVLRAEERVSDVLAGRLDAAEPGRWEIVNAGVPGFNTGAEVRYLEHVGLALRPETIVVAFSLNDYEDVPHMSPVGVLSRGDPRFDEGSLLDRSELLLVLRWGVAYWRGTLWHQFVAKAEDGVAHEVGTPGVEKQLDRWVTTRHLAFYRNPDPPTHTRLVSALRELHDVAAAHRMRLLLAIFPESYQIGLPEPDLAPQRVVLAACAAIGIRCLDLHPAFAAAGGDLFLDTQHPNARGHAIAAGVLAPVLLEPDATDREPRA